MDFFGFTFIMFVGAAIALLGFIILLFTAFTTSAGWGIGSLVVPPAVIAFAVSHWSKAKNGFAILMIGVIIFAYGSWDKNQMAANQVSSPSAQETVTTDQDTQPLAQQPPVTQDTQNPDAPVPSAAASPPPTTAAAPGADTGGGATPKPTVINIIDAHKYLNHEVRVTTDSGQVRTGTLIEVNDSGIVMDYDVPGATGRVRAEISEDHIHLIELLQ